jgi:hypothetical protein
LKKEAVIKQARERHEEFLKKKQDEQRYLERMEAEKGNLFDKFTEQKNLLNQKKNDDVKEYLAL